MSSSTLQRSVRSLAACAHATTWKTSLPYREVYYRDAKVCNNPKEIAQEQCVCRASELNIKRSMMKKDNGEVYKLRKTFAVLHLVPLFIGRGSHIG